MHISLSGFAQRLWDLFKEHCDSCRRHFGYSQRFAEYSLTSPALAKAVV